MKYLPSTALFVAAGVIAATGHDGWGWFLFLGFILL